MHYPYDQQLHAEGNINDFDDVMALIHDLWDKIYGHECEFLEEEPIGDDSEILSLPRIVYDLAYREHSKDMPQGQKPRQMKTYPDPEMPGHNITEATEFFDCVAEFNIYGNSKREAREWTKKFELFMLTYTGYLKQQGVQELLFMNEERPEVSTKGRQELPRRTLRYLVRIQRTQLLRTNRLSNIEMVAKLKNPIGETKELYPTSPSDEFSSLYNQFVK